MGFKYPQINEVRTDPILSELVRKILRRIFSRFRVSFQPGNTELVVLSFLEILYDRITNISESDHPRSYEATKAVNCKESSGEFWDFNGIGEPMASAELWPVYTGDFAAISSRPCKLLAIQRRFKSPDGQFETAAKSRLKSQLKSPM